MAKIPKQARGEAVVRKIIEGGLEVFLEQGYEGTSVDKVAANTRTSKATIYRLFKDKDALFQAVANHALRSGRTPVEFKHLPGEDIATSLYNFAEVMIDRVTSQKQIDLMRVYVFEIRRFVDIEKIFSRSDKEDEIWLVEIFGTLSSRGYLIIENSQNAADAFLNLVVNPFLLLELFRPRRVKASKELQSQLELSISQFLTLFPACK